MFSFVLKVENHWYYWNKLKVNTNVWGRATRQTKLEQKKKINKVKKYVHGGDRQTESSRVSLRKQPRQEQSKAADQDESGEDDPQDER